jgi:hypothetical protein
MYDTGMIKKKKHRKGHFDIFYCPRVWPSVRHWCDILKRTFRAVSYQLLAKLQSPPLTKLAAVALNSAFQHVFSGFPSFLAEGCSGICCPMHVFDSFDHEGK